MKIRMIIYSLLLLSAILEMHRSLVGLAFNVFSTKPVLVSNFICSSQHMQNALSNLSTLIFVILYAEDTGCHYLITMLRLCSIVHFVGL